jgi:hypothetical protein
MVTSISATGWSGRLAATGWAEKNKKFALVDLQIDGTQCDHGDLTHLVGLRQRAGGKHGCWHDVRLLDL